MNRKLRSRALSPVKLLAITNFNALERKSEMESKFEMHVTVITAQTLFLKQFGESVRKIESQPKKAENETKYLLPGQIIDRHR